MEKILNILEDRKNLQKEEQSSTTKEISNTTNNLTSSIHAPPIATKKIPLDEQPNIKKKEETQCSECKVLQNRILKLKKQMFLILEKLKSDQSQTKPTENSTMDVDSIQTSTNDF